MKCFLVNQDNTKRKCNGYKKLRISGFFIFFHIKKLPRSWWVRPAFGWRNGSATQCYICFSTQGYVWHKVKALEFIKLCSIWYLYHSIIIPYLIYNGISPYVPGLISHHPVNSYSTKDYQQSFFLNLILFTPTFNISHCLSLCLFLWLPLCLLQDFQVLDYLPGIFFIYLNHLNINYIFCFRTITIILVDNENQVTFLEKTMMDAMNISNPKWQTMSYEFTLS